MSFHLIYDKPGEPPRYLGLESDVEANDSAINAALPDVPVGTIIATAGYNKIKQLSPDGAWVASE